MAKENKLKNEELKEEKVSKKAKSASKEVKEKTKKETKSKTVAKAKKDTTTKKKEPTRKDAPKKEPVKKAASKKDVTKKSVSKKGTSKKDAKKAATSSKKTSSSKAKKTSSSKITPTAKPMLAEYYDLPYRYNQTTVKILAQTPTTLFVYWDISDDDRNILTNRYGDNLFYETIPILIVHNTTKNYSFEIEINDFANSWYIRTQEPDCDYVIELGRKMIHNNNEYIHIYSSNNIVSPNDHILFEKSNLGNVVFKNVKTGVLSSKDFGSLRFINDMDKIYGNVYDVYSALYKEETLNDFTNPSSGEFILRK